MERIKGLGGYQKAVLLLLIIMVLVFTVIYSVTVSREGFLYMDTVLVPNQENGNTVYSGKIDGEKAIFTVSADKTVTYQYGNKMYGPYTAKKDSTALPADPQSKALTGVELRCGEEVVFRGGVWKGDDYWWIEHEERDSDLYGTHTVTVNGVTRDTYGNIVDIRKPSVSTILDLMAGPELTHEGNWLIWFFGVLMCVLIGVSILFADELFRMNMAFHINHAELAEPSDWTIACRYFAWTVMPVCAFVVFMLGLQHF